MDLFAENTLSMIMTWVHLAIMAVPLLIVIAHLEWRDWKLDHPRGVVRPPERRRIAPRIPPFFQPKPV